MQTAEQKSRGRIHSEKGGAEKGERPEKKPKTKVSLLLVMSNRCLFLGRSRQSQKVNVLRKQRKNLKKAGQTTKKDMKQAAEWTKMRCILGAV